MNSVGIEVASANQVLVRVATPAATAITDCTPTRSARTAAVSRPKAPDATTTVKNTRFTSDRAPGVTRVVKRVALGTVTRDVARPDTSRAAASKGSGKCRARTHRGAAWRRKPIRAKCPGSRPANHPATG